MLTFLIPAYNEEKRIGKTLEALTSSFPDSKCLIVFDGNDRTPEVASKFPNVKILKFSKRLGKGRALIEGIKKIDSDDLIVLIDADLPVDVKDIKKAISIIGKTDMLIGSRIYFNLPKRRLYLHKSFNALVKLFFPQLKQFVDFQAGFKLIKINSLRKVEHELIMNDYLFDINLIYSFIKHGLKVIEYPVLWRHEELESKISKNLFKIIILFILSLIKLRIYYSPFKKFLNTNSYLNLQNFLLKILR